MGLAILGDSMIALIYQGGRFSPTDTRDDDNRWDVESAWLLYQTLEAATGRPVAIYQLNDLPEDLRKTGSVAGERSRPMAPSCNPPGRRL